MPGTDTPVKDKLAGSPRVDEKLRPCPICGTETPQSRKYGSDECRQSAHRVRVNHK